MQKLIFPLLLILLFFVSYSFRGVVIPHDTTNQKILKAGIHSTVQKAPMSFDMSARAEE